jgi:3-hydroxyisobutyrate dehydrogenase
MFSFDVSDIEELDAVEHLCWRALTNACIHREAGMHTMVVSTLRNETPMSRVVVLRRVDPDTRKLYFHTDIRKDLLKDLQANPGMSWLGYDKTLRSQIRMFGKTILHHRDELAMEHWQKIQHPSRRCYLQTEAPGSWSDGSAHNEDLSGFSYSWEESELGFENFIVAETQVEWMDWYFTHNRGNRRAHFEYKSGSMSRMNWLHP